MIEFLTFVHNHRRASGLCHKPLLVVYVGSSILAAVAGCEAYPGTKFVCFDPSWKMTVPVFHRESGASANEIMDRRVRTFKSLPVKQIADALRTRDIAFVTDSAGRFTSATCRCMGELRDQMRDYEMVLVSDIRTSVKHAAKNKEVLIAEDMVTQASWVGSLNTRYYSLKLRLPFAITRDIATSYEKLAKVFPGKAGERYRGGDVLPYLSGLCVLQKYARNMSTEMRLLGCERPHLTGYNVTDIERAFFPFNTIYRKNTLFCVSGAGKARVTSAMRILQHARTVAGSSRVTFDELGEAMVLADAACLASELSGADSSNAFEKQFTALSTKILSLFASRR